MIEICSKKKNSNLNSYLSRNKKKKSYRLRENTQKSLSAVTSFSKIRFGGRSGARGLPVTQLQRPLTRPAMFGAVLGRETRPARNAKTTLVSRNSTNGEKTGAAVRGHGQVSA